MKEDQESSAVRAVSAGTFLHLKPRASCMKYKRIHEFCEGLHFKPNICKRTQTIPLRAQGSSMAFIPLPLPPFEKPMIFNKNYVLHWILAGLDLNRISHSVGGPQTRPPISARAVGMLQLAVHNAYLAIKSSSTINILGA
jgi:hypothetical protein